MEKSVEKISTDDFEYLNECVENAQKAEVALVAAQGALEAWKGRLMRKYGLAGGDAIGPEGAISRQAKPDGGK